MKELPFPEGVKPLDIFVSSVNKRRLTEEFEGRSGTLNYGYDYGERSVDLSLWLEAHDTIDYRLIRNELYAFFDTHDVFYIEETRVPSRVLKVTIDESYIPERINQTHSSVEISCRTLDSVFWESKYTTLELHDSGYSATAEKYGLVDNIDDEKVKYRFTPQTDYIPNLIPLTQSGWEVGNWYTTNGTAGSETGNLRTKIGQISVTEGEWYTFDDSSAYASAIDTVYLLHYKNGTYVGSSGGWLSLKRGGRTSFVAKGDEIRISLRPMDVNNIPLGHINHADKRIQMKLELGEDHTGYNPESSSFNVYNAGNVAVEPESMYISILFWYCSIPNGKMTIQNMTTGDVLEINRTENRKHIRQDGMVVTVAGVNRFRDTNRRFISLAPGDNRFEITGATFDEVRIDFKNYYK